MNDIDTILAGLLDGTSHATCQSCRDVMRRAYEALRAAKDRETELQDVIDEMNKIVQRLL